MSKRCINKQQAKRIKNIQKKHHENKESSLSPLAEGLVITQYSKHVEVEDSSGHRVICSIRPNIETLVAGDRIIWKAEGDNQGVVVSLYPRNTVLARPRARGTPKAVAANIGQLIIIIAPIPEINWPLLDSYLIMAKLLKLKAVIVLNKTDLPIDHIRAQLFDHYKPLNYPIVFCNQNERSSLNSLMTLLDKEVSVCVGQSGVGKSSLIARILPQEHHIQTSSLSLTSQLGKHTTSNSSYYHLQQGGALIDSPGVRAFSLWHINLEQITQGYSEFIPYTPYCKFRNCTHKDTPHCAVVEAVNQGKISILRYENYIKLYMQHSQE